MILIYAATYPIFALIDLFVTWVIAAILVNWWAPRFAALVQFSNRGVVQSAYKLPRWLAWFDTFDAGLDQGMIDGSITGPSTYWNRVRWLYRNGAYGFSYWVLGVEFAPANWRVVRSDATTFVAVANGHFSVHITRVGLQFKFGWKAWNCYDASAQQWLPQPWGPVWRLPFVFSISLA
jgi:hypothetical protein